LLLTLGLVLDQPTLVRFALWSALLIDLWLKLSHEERLLARRFPDYSGYKARTKRLIPFLL
jgi:protein-S-isoprenylcysteine O-methyltransferase Ste14